MKGSRTAATAFLGLLLLAVSAMAQDRFAEVEVKATHVAGPVYMLTGMGGNIGVCAGEDGILMVDDQFAELAPKIRAALKDIQPGEPDFILNTHWHGDHTGGNGVFAEEGTVIAHHNVRRRLAGDPAVEGKKAENPDDAGLPVITYDQGLMIHFNNETIKLVHFPKGHTDGDTVVFFPKSKVVHTGDLFFSGLFPFVDLESGGDLDGYLNNMQKIVDMVPADWKIIPGHGPLSTVEDMKKNLEDLRASVEYIRKQLAAGKDLEHLVKERLPERWDKYDWRFISTERWIRTVAAQ